MYQKRISPYFIIPSTFSPQASSPLSHHRQTNLNTPLSLTSFFSLSPRGPTRRRNSTGLAELWGGWPIELGSTYDSIGGQKERGWSECWTAAEEDVGGCGRRRCET
jgi:hypothetical protein